MLTPCYINEANMAAPLLTVWTTRDINRYEELTFSYNIVDEDEAEEVCFINFHFPQTTDYYDD